MAEKDNTMFEEDEDYEEEDRDEDHPTYTKGRGFKSNSKDDYNDRYAGDSGRFEYLQDDGDDNNPSVRSVEGYVIMVTNVHEEAQEDDLRDAFGDFGAITNIHLNLDRRTGFVKGYALIEYKMQNEAENAINTMNNSSLLEQNIVVDYAFKKPSYNINIRRARGPRGFTVRRRNRSRSR